MISFGEYIVIVVVSVIVAGICTLRIKIADRENKRTS